MNNNPKMNVWNSRFPHKNTLQTVFLGHKFLIPAYQLLYCPNPTSATIQPGWLLPTLNMHLWMSCMPSERRLTREIIPLLSLRRLISCTYYLAVSTIYIYKYIFFGFLKIQAPSKFNLTIPLFRMYAHLPKGIIFNDFKFSVVVISQGNTFRIRNQKRIFADTIYFWAHSSFEQFSALTFPQNFIINRHSGTECEVMRWVFT